MLTNGNHSLAEVFPQLTNQVVGLTQLCISHVQPKAALGSYFWPGAALTFLALGESTKRWKVFN